MCVRERESDCDLDLPAAQHDAVVCVGADEVEREGEGQRPHDLVLCARYGRANDEGTEGEEPPSDRRMKQTC